MTISTNDSPHKSQSFVADKKWLLHIGKAIQPLGIPSIIGCQKFRLMLHLVRFQLAGVLHPQETGCHYPTYQATKYKVLVK